MTTPSDGTEHGDKIEALERRHDESDRQHYDRNSGDIEHHTADIEALQQELAATNVLLVGLSRELASDRVETAVRVEGLRAEQHRERRVRMMYVAGLGTLTVYGYDQHIEHCSPGARVQRSLDYLLTHPAKPGESPDARQAQFEHVYDQAPMWCDVTMPLHTHDGSNWPTLSDALGMGLVALAVLGTAIYHRLRTAADYARVRLAAEREGTSQK